MKLRERSGADRIKTRFAWFSNASGFGTRDVISVMILGYPRSTTPQRWVMRNPIKPYRPGSWFSSFFVCADCAIHRASHRVRHPHEATNLVPGEQLRQCLKIFTLLSIVRATSTSTKYELRKLLYPLASLSLKTKHNLQRRVNDRSRLANSVPASVPMASPSNWSNLYEV